MDQIVIPSTDVIALPAPYWVIKVLLIFTFILHLIAMNFLMGGSIIALASRLASRKNEKLKEIGGIIIPKLPSFFAATITLGIAPLLFIQTIYGEFIYTSSVIMAWPWLLVIAFLTIAYYSFYIIVFKKDKTSKVISWGLLVSIFFLFLISFIYSNNITLMMSPEKWVAMYHSNPSGFQLNLNNWMLYPRYLHLFTGSLVVASLMVTFIGYFRWKKDPLQARIILAYGSRWFVGTALIQAALGFLFLLTLPGGRTMLFLGQDMAATLCLLLSLILIGTSLVLVSTSFKKEDPRQSVLLAIILNIPSFVMMVVMRDILRDDFLAPYLNPWGMDVAPQWGVFAIFVVLLLGGLATWGFMVKKFFFEPKQEVTEKSE